MKRWLKFVAVAFVLVGAAELIGMVLVITRNDALLCMVVADLCWRIVEPGS